MAVKIVIVEDEQALAENIAEYLVQHGYEVVSIIKGEFDLESIAVTNLKVDIFLVDIMLEGPLNGIEMAKKLLELFPESKVIFSTALATRPILDQISFFEHEGYLLKPYSLKVLETTLYLAVKKISRTEDLSLGKKGNRRNVIPVREKGKVILIDENDIFYIKANGTITEIYTEKRVVKTRELLKNFLQRLSLNKFERIHKSYVVDLSKIDYLNSKKCGILNSEISVRRGIYKQLMEKLNEPKSN
jgi:two-component system, LytTR family, response regulator LytT